MRVDRFYGQAPRPDPDAVPCRFARNISLGPGGTFYETRPGTEHLAYAVQFATGQKGDPDYICSLQDDRIGGIVLVSISPIFNQTTASGLLFWPIANPQVTPFEIPAGAVNAWLFAENESGSKSLLMAGIADDNFASVATSSTLEFNPQAIDGEGWCWCVVWDDDNGQASIRYVSDQGLSAEVGTVTGLGSSWQAWMAAYPVDDENGVYVMFASPTAIKLYRCTSETLTLLEDDYSGSFTMGTGVGEYRNPAGLAVAPDGDLVFMIDQISVESPYAAFPFCVKVDPETGAVRIDFPTYCWAGTLTNANGGSASATMLTTSIDLHGIYGSFQLGPAGEFYYFLPDSAFGAYTGGSIYTFTLGGTSPNPVDTASQRCDPSLDGIYTGRVCPFAVNSNKDIGIILDDNLESSAVHAFVYDFSENTLNEITLGDFSCYQGSNFSGTSRTKGAVFGYTDGASKRFVISGVLNDNGDNFRSYIIVNDEAEIVDQQTWELEGFLDSGGLCNSDLNGENRAIVAAQQT